MTRFDAPGASAEEVDAAPPACDGPRIQFFEAREVPLGGVRAMSVHRYLPQRPLPLVGAWCFLDRFGPQTTRMRVEPHPHIGLQTVTWPFLGTVHHRDSIGSDVVIRRGGLNIMTSGHGISHSEYSVGDDPIPLDALQLWVALPESRRHGAPDFERHENLPVVDLAGGGSACVVVGEFAGATSPATMYTPIVGAEIALPAGTTTTLPLRADWEYALVAVDGAVEIADPDGSHGLTGDTLLFLGMSRTEVTVTAADGATLFLLGGEPFEDDIVMWWNFVGRTHEEIVTAREEWEAASERFGTVPGHGDVRIPAPPLPGVRLTRRRRGEGPPRRD